MKKKFLMILLAIGFVLPCGLFLVACGSTPDEKVATSLSVEISETSQYYQYYDGQCLNLTNNERNFTKDDFVVTIYYSDNSKEITQNYNFNADEELSVYDGTTNYYNIYFFKNDQQFATIMVKVEKLNEELPTLTGLRKDGDAFYLEQELRYNGEEQSAIDYIGTSENGVTLKSLIDENKVSISLGETISATDANDFYDGEYSYNTFILSAKDGYAWKDNETEIKNIRIKWQIKRKILETPTVTSGVEFEYAYQMDNGNLEGVERGLTFDYKGNESLINDNNVKLSYAGEHSWRLELYDSDNYAFLNGEQETNYLDYTWKITPKKLNINDVLIDDDSHFNGTDYRYTYTGQEIKPNLNISADCPVFYINYGNSGEASDNAYNVAVSVNTNLFFIPESVSVLNNFVWANGDKIDINYSKNLEFYIDKAQVVAPNGFDEISIKFNSQAYSADGNKLNNFNLTNDSYSSFTTETLNALNKLQMFDNSTGAGFEWEDGNQSLTVETNKAVLYWFSSRTGNYTNNYIPLTINVNVEITKAKAVIDPSWSQNTATNEWTIQSLNNNDDVNAVIDYITYKTYYSETGYSTSAEAENLTDAGYYTTIATLPENTNYEYYLNEDGEPITTLSNQWSIAKTNIDLGYNVDTWSLSDGTTTSNQLSSYYYKNDGVAVSKNVTFDISKLSSVAQNMFDVSVSHYVLESEGWGEATNCTEVGVYKSVATLTFKDGYKAKNYVVNYGAFNTDAGIQISKDWSIYPNTYTLTTTDATSENYVGWPIDVQTAFVYKGEYQNQQPEAIVPDGLYISYNWSNIDEIGSSDNYGRSGIGTYRIYADLAVQGLLGYKNVTVTIDGTKYLENGERIFYSSTGEEESRHDISNYNGIFYTGIDDLDYRIYEENFFAGKTFTFDSVVVSAVDGSSASAEAKTKASTLNNNNANTTMIFANSGNLVSGTCSFGEGSLNVLTASYIENEGKVKVSFSSSKSLVGTMIYDNTLVLTENDGTHIWTYTFKLPTVV